VGRRWERPLAGGGGPAELADPLVGQGGALSWPLATGVGIATALVTAFVLQPAWAVPIGVATFASARWRRWRPLLTVGAVAGVLLVGALYVARQVVSHPEPGFGWVTRYEFTQRIAFAAVLLVVADVVVERLRPARAARLR
jgi:hypothetical protein